MEAAIHQLAFRYESHLKRFIVQLGLFPKLSTLSSSSLTARKKEKKKGWRKRIITLCLSFSWSQLLSPHDRFNKPSSISPISPQRLAAVSTRGRGGRSFPTRSFVSLRAIVRNCYSIASPPPREREGFVNEPRMGSPERDRKEGREKERDVVEWRR